MNAGGEYPRCLHGAGGATCLVSNDDEKAAKLAEGWALLPVADVEPVTDAPKKRGRPPTEH